MTIDNRIAERGKWSLKKNLNLDQGSSLAAEDYLEEELPQNLKKVSEIDGEAAPQCSVDTRLFASSQMWALSFEHFSPLGVILQKLHVFLTYAIERENQDEWQPSASDVQ